MSKLKPQLSSKSPYYLAKHRYYELKHFCLQYPSWVRAYADLRGYSGDRTIREYRETPLNDLTSKYAIMRAYYAERINMIVDAAKLCDEDLSQYIVKGVTNGYSYNILKTKFGIPCSRDTYYDRYRRFFYILSQSRK